MADDNLLIILGNQLFPLEEIKKTGAKKIFMKEDLGLCTDFKHHKLKILFFLGAMREYKKNLEANGFEVFYFDIDNKEFDTSYLELLKKTLQKNSIDNILHFEIEDKTFAAKFDKFISSNQIKSLQIPTPMFLCAREEFKDFFGNKSLRMVSFYQMMRKKLNVLMENEKPIGGKWSFDDENRKKLPKEIDLPEKFIFKETQHTKVLKEIVEKMFSHHPGKTKSFWTCTNRKDTESYLDYFLDRKIENFGDYEDAVDQRDNILFHSALSPQINLGLLTPEEIISKIKSKTISKINSHEGYIRQLIGWREFIRGIYQNFDEKLEKCSIKNS